MSTNLLFRYMIGCFAHNLNLVTKDAESIISNILQKVTHNSYK